MKYNETVRLKDRRECCLRNGTDMDVDAVLNLFRLTHEQTDFLLSYPDESNLTGDQEAQFLREKTQSDREVELLAEVDGVLVGLAGISSVGSKDKVKHRAEFGISVDKEYWGLGIGQALTEACIKCAKTAGYKQVELTVVSENASAISLYQKMGFVEYGRNPKGFCSRLTGWQELVHMRLELSD